MRMMRMHVDGLKRIVEIRGGLAAIRSTNPNLANMIFGFVISLIIYHPTDTLKNHNHLNDRGPIPTRKLRIPFS